MNSHQNRFEHPSRAALLRVLHQEPSAAAATAENAGLARHLRLCPRCRRRFELLRELGAALRELPRPGWLTRGLRAGPELRARILERLRLETRRRMASWVREFVAHSLVLMGRNPSAVSAALDAAPVGGGAGTRAGRAKVGRHAPGGTPALARMQRRHARDTDAEAARRALVDVLVDLGRLSLRARRTLRDSADLPLDALPLRLPTELTAEAAIRRALALAAVLELGRDFTRAAERLLDSVSEPARAVVLRERRASVAHGGAVLARLAGSAVEPRVGRVDGVDPDRLVTAEAAGPHLHLVPTRA